MRCSSLFGAILVLAAHAPFAQAEDAPEPYEELPPFQTVGEPASDEDREAIMNVLRMSGQAWGEGDAKKLASFYSDDAEWMNAFGQIRRSSADIEHYLTELFAEDDEGMGEGEAQNGGAISLRYIGDDVAVFHGYTLSVRTGVLEGADQRRVHSTSILEKRDGVWLIVHEHISDARPAVD